MVVSQIYGTMSHKAIEGNELVRYIMRRLWTCNGCQWEWNGHKRPESDLHEDLSNDISRVILNLSAPNLLIEVTSRYIKWHLCVTFTPHPVCLIFPLTPITWPPMWSMALCCHLHVRGWPCAEQHFRCEMNNASVMMKTTHGTFPDFVQCTKDTELPGI